MLKYILIVVCSLCISSCILAPFIGSVKDAGLMKGDREALLTKDIKHFGDALYWGDMQQALTFVAPEVRSTLGKELNAVKGDRVIESSIGAVEFNSRATEAKVDLNVRYYKIPVYLVKTRTEKQTWVFDMLDGWKLEAREVIEEG